MCKFNIFLGGTPGPGAKGKVKDGKGRVGTGEGRRREGMQKGGIDGREVGHSQC
jgi:hypothetical protein